MSLPVGAGYAEIEWDAPSADVSGFSVILDAETKLGGLTSFTDDIDTTDGARGRIAQKSTGDEYAFDWIADDVSTDLGLIRFYADIVLAASGADARAAQIYAPNTRNTAYAVTDTYGQYNAYDSGIDAYWHDGSGLVDRTSNNRIGTQAGSPQSVDGLLGTATDYDGASDYCDLGQTWLDGYSELTLTATLNLDSVTGQQAIMSVWEGYNQMLFETNGTEGIYIVEAVGGRARTNLPSGSFAANTWITTALTFDNSNIVAYIDGVSVASSTTGLGVINTIDQVFRLANNSINSKLFDGTLQHLSIHSVSRSSSYINYEDSQTSDNSTFWGTATWVSGSTGTTILADIVSMESYVLSPLLSAGAVFSSSIQQVDIDALKESFAAGATISPGIQTINVDYLGAILAAGASIPANIQSIAIAPFIASFQTGNSISAELVSVTMTTQQAEFLAGVVSTQGLQSLAIDVLTPTFRAETLIISPLGSTTVDTLAPVFDLGGDYIRAELLTVDAGYFAPSFSAGAVMAAGIQTVEFQFLDATLAELGKITGLMKVSFSGAVPGTDFTGAVPGVILIGEVD